MAACRNRRPTAVLTAALEITMARRGRHRTSALEVATARRGRLPPAALATDLEIATAGRNHPHRRDPIVGPMVTWNPCGSAIPRCTS